MREYLKHVVDRECGQVGGGRGVGLGHRAGQLLPLLQQPVNLLHRGRLVPHKAEHQLEGEGPLAQLALPPQAQLKRRQPSSG